MMLIYCLDPLRTAKGRLSLKALRLTPTMMNMYREADFTHEACVFFSVILFRYMLQVGVLFSKSAVLFNFVGLSSKSE